MKKIKPILISIIFIVITGLLVWLGPEISPKKPEQAKTPMILQPEKEKGPRDRAAVFKAISDRMQKVQGTHLKVGDVQQVEMKGQKKNGTERHLEVVKQVKAMAQETCLKNKGDFAKMQEALNTFAKSKRGETSLGFNKIAIGLKFLNYQSPKCKGTLSVQTDYTEQEVKF